MHQKTIIVNAEDLFGSFSDPGEFQKDKNETEKYWDWPEDIGSGFMHIIKLRPGLMIGIGHYQLLETIELSFEYQYSPVTIGFSVSGSMSHTVESKKGQKNLWGFKPGCSVISYLPECQGVSKQLSGTPVDCLGIYIDPLLLNILMEGQHDQIPTDMRNIVNGANINHYYQISAITPLLSLAIHEIFNCPYQFPLKRLFLESKVLEIITHVIADFTHSKNALTKNKITQFDDIECIWEARRILIHSLENPPSLLDLARQVGINKNKLNQGFRQVFGTSVFDYLRIHRLELARELLENKKKNVTEVAFEVGYAQHSNFTKAFKKHFGINPANCLR